MQSGTLSRNNDSNSHFVFILTFNRKHDYFITQEISLFILYDMMLLFIFQVLMKISRNSNLQELGRYCCFFDGFQCNVRTAQR